MQLYRVLSLLAKCGFAVRFEGSPSVEALALRVELDKPNGYGGAHYFPFVLIQGHRFPDSWIAEQAVAMAVRAAQNYFTREPFDAQVGELFQRLHEWKLHPDYDYETTTYRRKQEDPQHDSMIAAGWEYNIFDDDAHSSWERFDHTEETYWRRLKQPGPAAEAQ